MFKKNQSNLKTENLENERKKLNEDKEKLNKAIKDSKEKRIKASSNILINKKNEKRKKNEIKYNKKNKDSNFKKMNTKNEIKNKVEIAIQKKALKDKKIEIKELKKVLKDKSDFYNAKLKDVKKNNTKIMNEKIISIEETIKEQRKNLKVEIEKIKNQSKEESSSLLKDKLKNKIDSKEKVYEFENKIETKKMQIREAKLKLKNIKYELIVKEKDSRKKEKALVKKTQNKESTNNRKKVIEGKLHLKLVKFISRIKEYEKFNKDQEDSSEQNYKNKKGMLENKIETKKIKNNFVEKIDEINHEIAKNESDFLEDFTSIFSGKGSSKNPDEEFSGLLLSKFGKKYSKKFISVQKPSNETDNLKFKNDPVARESIANFKKNYLKAVDIKTFFGYIEIILDKRFLKEETNNFHVHMITSLLSGHSIRFLDGFLVPIISRKKISIRFSEVLSNESYLVEYINNEIWNSINKMLFVKLNLGVPILLAKGLMVVKEDEIVKVFEDTNFIRG